MKDIVSLVLAIILFVVVLVAVLWMNLKAPCSTFRTVANKDIPARCLKEYTR